jgi:hypothetical protein
MYTSATIYSKAMLISRSYRENISEVLWSAVLGGLLIAGRKRHKCAMPFSSMYKN